LVQNQSEQGVIELHFCLHKGAAMDISLFGVCPFSDPGP
jgi:hypothetical protein